MGLRPLGGRSNILYLDKGLGNTGVCMQNSLKSKIKIGVFNFMFKIEKIVPFELII